MIIKQLIIPVLNDSGPANRGQSPGVIVSCLSWERGNRSLVHSRRDFLRRCAFTAAAVGFGQGVENGFAQVAKKIIILPILPAAGNVKVASVDITTGPLDVSIAPNGGFCALELASGIHINAVVDLQPKPNTKPAYFGVLKFLQLTHFRHRRSPANLGPSAPGANWACAESKAKWELDGQYPFHNKTVKCAIGKKNSIDLIDDPNVPVEDKKMPYETMEVDPLDTFQSWLIWEETDDNKQPTKTNKAEQYVLARVDWAWMGTAGDQNTATNVLCPSTAYPGHGWDLRGQQAQVLRILKGSAASTPPALNKIPTANPLAWGPVC
jgi:hypothetical protein